METKNAVNVSTELEYNDGLGDLLREKERLEFNWIKTSTVFIFLIAVIVAIFSFLFSKGKSFVDEQASQSIPFEEKIQTNSNKSAIPIKQEVTQTPIEVAKPVITKSSSPASTVSDLKPLNSKQQRTSNNNVSKPASSSAYSFKIIAGTFKNRQYANQQIANLKKNGFDGFIKLESTNSGSRLYKVQAGAFKTNESALSMKKKLSKVGIDSYITSY